MMKNIKYMKNLLLVLLIVISFSCTQNPHYMINGVFENGIGKQIVLEDISDLSFIKIIDSTRVDDNGKFSFKGPSFGEIKDARLSIAGTKFREDFLIEDTIINVKIAHKIVTKSYTKYLFSVERSKEDALYSKLKANYNTGRSKWANAFRANRKKQLNDVELAKADKKIEDEFDNDIIDTLAKYPDAYGTLFYIKNYMLGYESPFLVEKAFNNLSERIQVSKKGTSLKLAIEKMKSSLVGGIPEDFSIPSLDGSTTTLHEYRGKVLLIDFWATWCGPCIKSLPHIGEIYKEFSSKGLSILGISLDKDENKWRKFLKKNDYIVWDQASSIKEWQCPAAKIFGVNTIPATILIDKNGVIVAKGLRGAELEAKITELLSVK